MSDADAEAPVCRVCLAEASSSDTGPMLASCACSGTARNVHEDCLRVWMSSLAERGGNPAVCELCRTRHTGRAALLAEEALRCKRPPVPIVNETSPFTLAVCLAMAIAVWAHVLQSRLWPVAEPGLRPGVLLRFEAASIGFFAKSVVIISEYDHHGARGFIMNHPPNRYAYEREWPVRTPGIPHGTGGPVMPGEMEIVHALPDIPGAKPIPGTDLFVGGSRQKVMQRVEGMATPPVRLVSGYAGWYPFQLDGEVRRGVWTVLENVNASLLFHTPAEELWTVAGYLPRAQPEETGEIYCPSKQGGAEVDVSVREMVVEHGKIQASPVGTTTSPNQKR